LQLRLDVWQNCLVHLIEYHFAFRRVFGQVLHALRVTTRSVGASDLCNCVGSWITKKQSGALNEFWVFRHLLERRTQLFRQSIPDHRDKLFSLFWWGVLKKGCRLGDQVNALNAIVQLPALLFCGGALSALQHRKTLGYLLGKAEFSRLRWRKGPAKSKSFRSRRLRDERNLAHVRPSGGRSGCLSLGEVQGRRSRHLVLWKP